MVAQVLMIKKKKKSQKLLRTTFTENRIKRADQLNQE
jgi:hypothetical protein